jgi:hypothetical protein
VRSIYERLLPRENESLAAYRRIFAADGEDVKALWLNAVNASLTVPSGFVCALVGQPPRPLFLGIASDARELFDRALQEFSSRRKSPRYLERICGLIRLSAKWMSIDLTIVGVSVRSLSGDNVGDEPFYTVVPEPVTALAAVFEACFVRLAVAVAAFSWKAG